MPKADFNQRDPWTEADYLALGETDSRIELIDGGLWVSPAPTFQHQYLFQRLFGLVEPAANAAKLRVVGAGNVRLGPDRMLIPDITVADVPKFKPRAEAFEVVMIVEITSPSNAATDRTLKKALYAEAGIEWYLLVEPDHATYESISMVLYRLDGKEYVQHAVAANGGTLVTELPLPLEISTEYLLDF